MRIDANNQSDEWHFLVILTKSVDSIVQLMFRTDDKNVSADKKGLMSTVMDPAEFDRLCSAISRGQQSSEAKLGQYANSVTRCASFSNPRAQ